MSTYKIRLITAPTQDTFYRRLDVPRESYVEINKSNRVFLKHGNKKWKTYISSNDKSYLDEKKKMIAGLVFDSRIKAQNFIKTHKKVLLRLAKSNPTYKKFEIFTVSKKFMPEENALNYWNKK